jgi:hypothetical protein
VYYYAIALIKSFHKSPAKGDSLEENYKIHFHQNSDRIGILADEEK